MPSDKHLLKAAKDEIKRLRAQQNVRIRTTVVDGLGKLQDNADLKQALDIASSESTEWEQACESLTSRLRDANDEIKRLEEANEACEATITRVDLLQLSTAESAKRDRESLEAMVSELETELLIAQKGLVAAEKALSETGANEELEGDDEASFNEED